MASATKARADVESARAAAEARHVREDTTTTPSMAAITAETWRQ